jgi:hypothetical protein
MTNENENEPRATRVNRGSEQTKKKIHMQIEKLWPIKLRGHVVILLCLISIRE